MNDPILGSTKKMETLTQKGLSMILYMSQDMEINSTQKKCFNAISFQI